MATPRHHISTTSSPGPQRSRPYYIYELPYCAYLELCRNLDADKQWQMLAGKMGMDPIDIRLFADAPIRHGSSADEVLKKFGERNGKISEVFVYLYKMKYFKGMQIIKDYVDTKYWQLLNDDEQFGDTSQLIARHEPSAPPYPPSSIYNTKAQPDSRNVNLQKNISKVHKSSKLPSPVSGKTPMGIPESILSSGVKILTLKNLRPMADAAAKQLNTNRAPNLNFQELDLGNIKRIPYEELAKATDFFSDTEILGRGGFGVVYRGNWKDSDVAIKKLRVGKGGSQEHIRQVLTELRVLEKCRFKNILALYGVSVDNGCEPCLVYEFMQCGSLDDRLRRRLSTTLPLTWAQRGVVAKGTARGLYYLHTVYDTPLIHGDVKPANILLDANLEPKLGDFGLTREGPTAAQTHRDVSHVHGTRHYLPHEYLQGKVLTTKVDIYSFGIVLLELATNQKVFDEHRPQKLLSSHIQSLRFKVNHWTAKDPAGGEDDSSWFELFVDLGLRCSAYSRKERPEIKEVLEELKEGKLSRNTPQTMPTGYSRDPTVTVNQNLGQVNYLHPTGPTRSPRLSPSDNLQCGNLQLAVPQSTATTNLIPSVELGHKENNTLLPQAPSPQIPAISLLDAAESATVSQ